MSLKQLVHVEVRLKNDNNLIQSHSNHEFRNYIANLIKLTCPVLREGYINFDKNDLEYGSHIDFVRVCNFNNTNNNVNLPDNVLLAGFGVGLSTSCILLEK